MRYRYQAAIGLALGVAVSLIDTADAQDLDNFLYWYECRNVRVIDGDTVECAISLGMGVSLEKQVLRLARINAPETNRKGERAQGLRSKEWLNSQIGGRDVIVRTDRDKTGRYGRYIADVFYDGRNLNDELVAHGLAEYKEY